MFSKDDTRLFIRFEEWKSFVAIEFVKKRKMNKNKKQKKMI